VWQALQQGKNIGRKRYGMRSCLLVPAFHPFRRNHP
jgi:hypothetical protein